MRGVLAMAAVLVALPLAGCLGPETDPLAAAVPEDVAGNPPLPATLAWRALTPGPEMRNEICAANVGPLFYAIGGLSHFLEESLPGPAGQVPALLGPVRQSARVDVYDAEKDAWSAGPAYPSNLDHCMAVAHEDWIYVFHGAANHHKLKVGTSEWIPIADSPGGHNYGGIGAIDGKIYLAAGAGGGSEFVDVYDPTADTWTNIPAEIPTRRGHASGAAAHGRLYVIGGDVGSHADNTAANEEFDPATGQWTRRADLPVMRGSLWAVEWMGRIVVMGGQDGGGGVPSFDDVHAYDPLTDSWTELPPMNTPRHGFAGGVWNGAIYTLLGAAYQGSAATNKADVLEPVA